jgi:hypothetical protein
MINRKEQRRMQLQTILWQYPQHLPGSTEEHHDKPVNSMKSDSDVWSHRWVTKQHMTLSAHPAELALPSSQS